jgi:hypothetical protein
LIGPPTAPLMSYSFFSESVVVVPLARSRSLTLLPWSDGADPLASSEPWNVLPPDFGIAFMITPLVPDSGICPENDRLTSS